MTNRSKNSNLFKHKTIWRIIIVLISKFRATSSKSQTKTLQLESTFKQNSLTPLAPGCCLRIKSWCLRVIYRLSEIPDSTWSESNRASMRWERQERWVRALLFKQRDFNLTLIKKRIRKNHSTLVMRWIHKRNKSNLQDWYLITLEHWRLN